MWQQVWERFYTQISVCLYLFDLFVWFACFTYCQLIRLSALSEKFLVQKCFLSIDAHCDLVFHKKIKECMSLRNVSTRQSVLTFHRSCCQLTYDPWPYVALASDWSVCLSVDLCGQLSRPPGEEEGEEEGESRKKEWKRVGQRGGWEGVEKRWTVTDCWHMQLFLSST